MDVCIYVYAGQARSACVCIHKCMYVYMAMYINVCMYTYINVCMYTFMYMYVCMYVYAGQARSALPTDCPYSTRKIATVMPPPSCPNVCLSAPIWLASSVHVFLFATPTLRVHIHWAVCAYLLVRGHVRMQNIINRFMMFL